MANYIINPVTDGNEENISGDLLELMPNDSQTRIFYNPEWIRDGDVLYIHIAMSADLPCPFNELTDPTIWLKAGTSGNQIELSANPKTLYYDESDSLGSIVGQASLTADGDVFKVQVADIANYRSIARWEIQIRNNAEETLQVVWVAADSPSDAGQPWMDVSSSLDFGIVKVGETRSKPLSIANRGTGPLIVTGPKTLRDFIFPTPVRISANTCDEMTVDFTPTSEADGTIAVTVDIESNDSLALGDATAKHNKQVILSATCSSAPATLAAPTLRIVYGH